MESLENFWQQNKLPFAFIVKLKHACECSPYLARWLQKDPVQHADLLENHTNSYGLAEMQQFLATQSIQNEISLKRALRLLRQRVYARVILRDCIGLADLTEVMQTMSALADFCILETVKYQQSWLESTLGIPQDTHGKRQSLMVIAMGKLGGGELNVSSDIDLIFAYNSEGQTSLAEINLDEINLDEINLAETTQNQTKQGTTNQAFFNQLAKRVIATLDEMTEDGFVFRVDMRLRPFGSEGALVANLEALESYYQTHGREWERYAWVKARVVTQDASVERLMQPFVYRKYLDFNVFSNLRQLKKQMHQEVLRKGQQDNIKLGRGGIREVEFIAQVFQLVRGGYSPALQLKSTLATLRALQTHEILNAEIVQGLIEAYTFLRDLEHRLMYVEDQQTQDLPKNFLAQTRIAKAMQFADWSRFLEALNRHRQRVQTEFDAIFSEDLTVSESKFSKIWQGDCLDPSCIDDLKSIGYQDCAQVAQWLHAFKQSQKVKHLPEDSKLRVNQLMPLLIEHCTEHTNADAALLRVIHLLEAIARRASYLALLVEFPHVTNLLVKLCAASPWLAQYLAAHPVLLDELIDGKHLNRQGDFALVAEQLTNQLKALQGDVEAQMDAMRHVQQQQVLRIATQDVQGGLTPELVSDELSALADCMLQVGLATVWADLKYQHVDQPKFAVIGYGKLGSKELGYQSDLDIVFLYEDAFSQARAHADAAEIYARYAQRLNHWFGSLTNAGLLYEIDLQLRPDGNSGLLVSSVHAFRNYQGRKAWVWEHQALTRARFVAGDASVGAEFETIRQQVLTQPRDADQLRHQVREMREKMRAANPIKSNIFDIKHSVGGIIDIEFIVQYYILNYANKYTQLIENKGNIAILKTLSQLAILPEKAAQSLSVAYRDYRKKIHQTKLQQTEAKVDLSQMTDETKLWNTHVKAVNHAWKSVFEA